jgi:flagellar FliL protein
MPPECFAMKIVVKWVIPIVAQLGLAWAAVVFLVGPMMRGEPLAWQKSEEELAEAAKSPTLGPLLPVEDILVNVAETQGRRYFKTSLTLEMEGKDLPKEAEQRLPLLRGAVIDLFSTKTLDQLVQPTSRDSLRSEILQKLNGQVTAGQFRDVYFTEFLVQ